MGGRASEVFIGPEGVLAAYCKRKALATCSSRCSKSSSDKPGFAIWKLKIGRGYPKT